MSILSQTKKKGNTINVTLLKYFLHVYNYTIKDGKKQYIYETVIVYGIVFVPEPAVI